MKITEIIEIVNGMVQCGNPETGDEVQFGFASDLMSDVLTLLDDRILLITGLNNSQSIRTAAMADIHTILFTRGKKPTAQMKQLAEEDGIILITTSFSSFRTSALLYEKGLESLY